MSDPLLPDPVESQGLAARAPTAAGASIEKLRAIGGAGLTSSIGANLALGMFLHHFSLGAWSVTLASYVKANSGEAGMGAFSAGFVGTVYAAGPLGGLVSPFITGFLADRYFASERLMAVLHLMAAGAMWMAARADTQTELFAAILLFYLCCLPTFTLMASMSFHQFAEPERHFPVVRACGTLGWVAAGIFVGWLWPFASGQMIETTATPLRIGMVCELLVAGYCLLLPHTPPTQSSSGGGSALGAAAIGELLRSRPFVILLAAAALMHVLPQFYYAYANVFFNWSGVDYAAAKMTGGQVVEIICMMILPLVLPRIGVRRAVLLGLATWTVRYFLLAAAAEPTASASPALRVAAVLTHGLAFAFVTLSLQLDVDRYVGRRLRATGQGLIVVAMQGVGYGFGAELAGIAGQFYLPAELDAATPANWRAFWILPAVGMAAVTAVVWFVFPRDGAIRTDQK